MPPQSVNHPIPSITQHSIQPDSDLSRLELHHLSHISQSLAELISVFVCFACNFSFISLEQLKRVLICTFAELKLLTNVSQLQSQAGFLLSSLFCICIFMAYVLGFLFHLNNFQWAVFTWPYVARNKPCTGRAYHSIQFHSLYEYLWHDTSPTISMFQSGLCGTLLNPCAHPLHVVLALITSFVIQIVVYVA